MKILKGKYKSSETIKLKLTMIKATNFDSDLEHQERLCREVMELRGRPIDLLRRRLFVHALRIFKL